MTGAFFDTVNTVLVYLFSRWLFSGNSYGYTPELVAALYAFSPALLRIGSGPRAYNGSPRVIGQTLYLLHIFSFYYALATNNFYAFFICVLSGSLIILISKFGIQVSIFFGIFFSIFISYLYIIILFLCFLLALAIARKHAFKTISGQFRHSSFYVKYLQKVFLYPHVRSARDYCRNVISAAWNLVRHRKILDFLNWYFNENYPLHLLITVFPQFFLLVLFINDHKSPADLFILTWAGSGLICFILTRFIKIFMFLGEGERYLEYALYPSLIIAIKTLSGPCMGILYVFLLYSLIAAVYYQWRYWDRFRNADSQYSAHISLFKKLDESAPGIIMPIGSVHWLTLFHSSFPVLTLGGNIDENLLPPEEFMFIFGNYPYPSEHFKQIIQKYNVAYIVTDDESINHYKNNIVKDSELFDSSVELVHESSSLKLFKVVHP